MEFWTFTLLSVLVMWVPSTCLDIAYTFSEEKEQGAYIGNVADDSNLRANFTSDVYQHVTFTFLNAGHEDAQYFTIGKTDGTIHTATYIDRENITKCRYSNVCLLSVEVAAKSEITADFVTLRVNFTIKDINDNAPQFPVDKFNLEISETSTEGALVPLIGAIDTDAGINSIQRYYVLPENSPFRADFEKFVDGSTIAKLVITGKIDRELRSSYTLQVLAIDGGNKTDSLDVNVKITDVNDNSPNFTKSEYDVSVEETVEINTVILTLNATDPDENQNGDVVYRLSLNQPATNRRLFAINETTGALSVIGQLTSSTYDVYVQAADRGSQSRMTQTIVHVTVLDTNNNIPEINVDTFTDTNVAVVSEYAMAGTVVALVSVVDKDTGINGECFCAIDSSGVFGLKENGFNKYRVTVSASIDRERNDRHFVTISCNDKGNPPMNSTKSFSIQVTDENDNTPIFSQEGVYIVDMNENNKIGQEVVQVTATDFDIGRNGDVDYTVLETTKYVFTVDDDGYVRAMSVLDREEEARVTVHIVATDDGDPRRSSTATLVINLQDENDNNPVFTSPKYEFTVSENVPKGTIVGRLNASDSDDGKNGEIKFILQGDLPFSVDSSGRVTTTEDLDREIAEEFNFVVTAYDKTAFDRRDTTRRSNASIVVRVMDVNDNTPYFIFPNDTHYTLVIPTNTAPGQVIGKIIAADNDTGNNGQLIYSITSDNFSDIFSISPITGEISMTRELSDTDARIFSIGIQVSDNGEPPRHSTKRISIFLHKDEPKTTETAAAAGEYLVIAVSLGSVTLVLVLTIILTICVLKRKKLDKDDAGESEDGGFYSENKVAKRVQFVDATDASSTDQGKEDTDVNDNQDMQIRPTSQPRDESQSTEQAPSYDPSYRNSPNFTTQEDRLSQDIHPSPRSGHPSAQSTPRSDTLATLQSHHALLQQKLQGHTFLTFGYHDDTQSQGSAETNTSDSGRGGSESDIHSTSLSQSHDSDTSRSFRKPVFHQSLHKPWLHPSHSPPKTTATITKMQQLSNNYDLHRIQQAHQPNLKRGLCTQSHSSFDRSRFENLFPPPTDNLDHSFMTYEEEDDDASTTTSGSYTIDPEEINAELQFHGLRSCLV